MQWLLFCSKTEKQMYQMKHRMLNLVKRNQIIFCHFSGAQNILTVSPCRGVRPHPKRYFIGMMINCIWWWDFRSKELESVDYPFIAITPRSTLVVISGRVPSKVEIDLFKKDFYLRGLFAKKKKHLLRNDDTKI